MLKIYQIPFLIVLFSLTLPIPSAYFNNVYLSYLADIASLIIFGFYLTYLNFKLPGKFIKNIIIPLITFLSINYLAVNSIGTKSVYTIPILTYIFYLFISKSKIKNITFLLLNQIKKIYLTLLIFLIFEFFIVLIDFDNLFIPISTVAHPENFVKLYKFYNSASLFEAVGLSHMHGLNSILLGSQSASIIILISLLIFSKFIKTKYKIKNDFYIFLFCLISYPFLATITSNLGLIITLILLIFIFPNSLIKRIKYQILLLSSFIFFGYPLVKIIAFRIRSLEELEFYFINFYQPVQLLLQSSLKELIFGIDILDTGLTSADFGFGIVLITNGIFITSFLIISFLILFNKTLKYIKINKKNSLINNEWSYLAALNSLASFIWIFSLIHYTTTLETGGRHLLSFHLSILIFSIKNLREKNLLNQLDSESC